MSDKKLDEVRTPTEEDTWEALSEGGIIPRAGNSTEYFTGSWRVERPVWNAEKCINCYQCWITCPDASILLDAEGKVAGIDYDHCKGCGVCFSVCPPKVRAIEMILESDAVAKEGK